MLKKYQLFKESKTVLVKRPWIFDGNFCVTEEMVNNRSLIKEQIPDEVTGYFDCSELELTTLEGCPKKFGSSFYCHNNQLTSLEGCPTSINGDFLCNDNKLTTLKYCPIIVSGNFDCFNNHLTSLEGCPNKIGNYFNCSYNQLTSLEGSPDKINGNLYCSNNLLTSLFGCSINVEKFINCLSNSVDLTIEKDFIKSGFCRSKETYWIDLLQYMIDKKIDLNEVLGWPKEFIETLDDYHKCLFKSFKGLTKFNL